MTPQKRKENSLAHWSFSQGMYNLRPANPAHAPPPTPQPWAGVLSYSSRAPSSSPKELEEHTSPPLQENELRGVGSAGRMRSYANECKVAANPSLLFLNLPLSSGR